MSILQKYEDYINGVLRGDILACETVKLSVKRHVKDLSREKKADFPYYFDDAEAERIISFVRQIRHIEGRWAGQFFDPAPYQVFMLAVLFGWRHKKTKKRRFRRAYIEMARKGAKSFLGSVIEIIGLLLDGENGPQIFSAATTRDQAKIVFNVCKEMVKWLRADSSGIAGILDIYEHRIVNYQNGGIIAPLSSDPQKLDGRNPHVVVVDEFHEHKTNKVLKVFETGGGARTQPLSVVITTAGFNLESPCFRLRRTAIEILRGVKTDETFFAIIFTIDEGDDWHDPACWGKANPNLGESPSVEFMQAEYQKALNEGSEAEVQFLTKNLNVWVRSKEAWLGDQVWMNCGRKIDWGALAGLNCWAALDMGEVFDFTALTLVFADPDTPDAFLMRWWFWLPEKTAYLLQSRGYGDIIQWAKDGWITLTPGDVVDLDAVMDEIALIGKDYRISQVAIDPWGSKTNILKLAQIGMTVVEVRQGTRTLSAPTKDFMRLVSTGKISHDLNPVMRWQMGNVSLFRGSSGDIKPDRKNKNDKIDGVISAIMGLGLAIEGVKQGAGMSYIFNSKNILTLK